MESRRMRDICLLRQAIGSLTCFGNAVHNRSLCKEARPTVRVSGNVAALIQKAINSDQSSDVKRSILAFHKGF